MLLRIMQALLGDVRGLVAEARWGELDDALRRIQGAPNNFESNVRDAAYSEHLTLLTHPCMPEAGPCCLITVTMQSARCAVKVGALLCQLQAIGCELVPSKKAILLE